MDTRLATTDLAAAPVAASPLAAERSPVRHVDLVLVLSSVGLAIYGLFMVYSATRTTLSQFGEDPGFYLEKQMTFVALAVAGMIVAAVLDYRWAKLYAPAVYLFVVLLLLLVQTPLGNAAKGAQRSFDFGGFQLTPSLFMRIALVLLLASMLSSIRVEIGLRHVVRATMLALAPMVLVFIQPDLGSTIVLAVVLVALLVASGARVKHLAVLALVALAAIFGAFQTHMIKDYQVDRLRSFFDDSADVQSAGYNKRQSEIAVGSGGIVGRGYLRGTQTNLDFVPEQHTDFIFTVVGEELGFIGAIGLLLLFAVLLWRILRIAVLSKDPFGTFLAVGVAAMLVVQIFVNVGMTIGIMPITGIPLPFVSYGGSALIADFIAIGLVQSVHMRRFL